MKRSSGLLALLASLAVIACSACGGARTPANAPESDPWAGYKGTYAPGGSQTPEPTASDTKPDAKPDTRSVAAADTKTDSKPSRTTESKTASAAEPKPKAAPKAAPNDAKAMYGIASDSKPEELTPDAAPAPAAKKPMKKRAGAIAGKKTVAKKAAKR